MDCGRGTGADAERGHGINFLLLDRPAAAAEAAAEEGSKML
jgi:hypothetical protein